MAFVPITSKNSASAIIVKEYEAVMLGCGCFLRAGAATALQGYVTRMSVYGCQVEIGVAAQNEDGWKGTAVDC